MELIINIKYIEFLENWSEIIDIKICIVITKFLTLFKFIFNYSLLIIISFFFYFFIFFFRLGLMRGPRLCFTILFPRLCEPLFKQD